MMMLFFQEANLKIIIIKDQKDLNTLINLDLNGKIVILNYIGNYRSEFRGSNYD